MEAIDPDHIIMPPVGTEKAAAATPRLVLAADAVVAPVPPLTTGTAFTRPSAASSKPLEVRLFANCDKLYACVI
jgi:hypothetical protein